MQKCKTQNIEEQKLLELQSVPPPQNSIPFPFMMFKHKIKLWDDLVEHHIYMFGIPQPPFLPAYKGEDENSKTKNTSQLHTEEIPINGTLVMGLRGIRC